MKKPVKVVSLGFLWFGLLVLYLQMRGFQPLTYDTPLFLAQHPAAEISVTSPTFWQIILTGSTANLWHPLTDLSHQLLFRLSEGPLLHLAVNVLLHGLNASLIFILIGKITKSCTWALLASILFAWHPISVESVAWIAGRKDLLCTFFLLLTAHRYFSFFQKSETTDRTSMPWTVVLFTIAACLSKPIAFVIPLLLIALDYWPLERKTSLKNLLFEKWGLFAISAITVLLTLFFQGRGTQAIDDQRAFSIRGTEALWALHQSLEALFLPFNLHLAYQNPTEIALGTILLGSGILLVVAALALAFVVRKRQRALVVGLGWYLVALLPTLGLIRAGNHLAADRYSYLPLIGIMLALVGVASCLNSRQGRAVFATVLALVAVSYLPLSFHQISHWRTQQSLFAHVLKKDPTNPTAQIELAALSFREGRFSEATQQLQSVVEQEPNSAGAHFVLGHIAYEQKDYSQAYHHYEISSRIRNREAFLQERLAACAHGMGDLAKTKAHLIAAFERELPRDHTLELRKKWHLLFPELPIPENSPR